MVNVDVNIATVITVDLPDMNINLNSIFSTLFLHSYFNFKLIDLQSTTTSESSKCSLCLYLETKVLTKNKN